MNEEHSHHVTRLRQTQKEKPEEVTNADLLLGELIILSSMEDLQATVDRLQQDADDAKVRDQNVAAGVADLQQKVTDLENQLANVPNAPDLTPIKDQLDSIASEVEGLDTEDTSVPQPPATPPPATP